MLDELHQRFPHNLAMQSLGSFDRPHNRAQYQAMVRLEGNDVAQVHRYLDLGANLEICHGPVDVLTADAIRELMARKTMLVWGRDVKNSWQSELADGVEPRELEGLTIDMSSVGRLAGASVRIYDPWNNVWSGTQPDGDTLALPLFKRSIVVKIIR
jgi:hypothetical protein